MRNRFLLSAALTLLGTTALAQSPVRLIGNTLAGPSNVLTQDFATCAVTQCASPLPGLTLKPAGGTAFDATQSIVWISTGPTLAAVDPDTCKVVCPPHVPPGISPNEQISGLACNERTGMLIATTTANNIILWKLSCPISSQILKCNVTPALPTGHTLSGIACDDVRNEVIYASGDWINGIGGGMFFVAPLTSPCTPICKFGSRTCGTSTLMGVVAGVAYDPCKQIVWWTDGFYESGLAYNRNNCAVTPTLCCKLPGNDRYCGLCIRPSHAAPSGKNCTDATFCPSCPGMQHVTIGDPTIGNASFGLALQNAPTGGFAWLFLNGGPCTPPGIFSPPLCAGLQVGLVPAPWMLGPFPMGGTPPCGGSHSITFSIPPSPILCGATLSSQYLGLCKMGVVSFFVSNCLSWTITGS